MSEKITVVYDGDALQDHLFDVHELAPALLSINSLINDASIVLYGKDHKISVKVKALNQGSFEIQFYLDLIGRAVSVLTSPEVNAILAVLGSLGFAKEFGLFQLLKKLKGKSPKAVIILGDGGSVEYTTEDGEKLIVKAATSQLFQNSVIRDDAEKVLKPLKKDGIDTFKILKDKDELLNVESSEIKYFDSPKTQIKEIISDTINPKTFSVHTLDFEGDTWVLSDGSNEYKVSVKDRKFLLRIDNNLEPFFKGNILTVSLRTIQYKDQNGKLKTDYEVIEVIKNETPPQLGLGIPFE